VKRAAVPISACVITLEEADRIGECLRSLAFCEEIIVVDSGSADATCRIAESLGARVLVRAFDGYRSQKDFAVQQALHDWVLCLDADERVDQALRASILAARDGGFAGAAGYRFNRLSDYFGRFLRHGNAYPDRVLRLFDRRRGGWRGIRQIHEAASVDGPVRTLAGHLLHFPYRSLEQQLAKTQRYALMMAQHEFAAASAPRGPSWWCHRPGGSGAATCSGWASWMAGAAWSTPTCAPTTCARRRSCCGCCSTASRCGIRRNS